MAEIGDVLNEFKNAKPPEKALIVGSIILVAGIAFYVYKKQQAGTSTNTTGNTSTTSQASGIPTIDTSGGQVPLLPSNVNPIYDSSGNLVGYQNAPTSPPVSANPVTTPPVTPTPPVSGTPVAGPGTVSVSHNLNHVTANGTMTLDQIAKAAGLAGWNSLAIIPENQNTLGKHSASTYKTLVPKAGTVLVTGKAGGGTSLGNHANPRNLAMINRQQTMVTKAYATRFK